VTFAAMIPQAQRQNYLEAMREAVAKFKEAVSRPTAEPGAGQGEESTNRPGTGKNGDMTDTPRRETLRQFTERRIREVAQEYGVTQKEVRDPDVYPASHWYGEWFDAIKADAAAGKVIDTRALDALEPMHRRYIAHDYPNAIPAGYVFPEATRTTSIVRVR
jgi:hypothetical protein